MICWTAGNCRNLSSKQYWPSPKSPYFQWVLFALIASILCSINPTEIKTWVWEIGNKSSQSTSFVDFPKLSSCVIGCKTALKIILNGFCPHINFSKKKKYQTFWMCACRLIMIIAIHKSQNGLFLYDHEYKRNHRSKLDVECSTINCIWFNDGFSTA